MVLSVKTQLTKTPQISLTIIAKKLSLTMMKKRRKKKKRKGKLKKPHWMIVIL